MEDFDLFWIAGSLHGRMPLLSGSVRAAVDLALVDMAWKAFIRDAGPGDTGPLFSGWRHSDHVLLTEDPRVGSVLAYLASRDGPLRQSALRLQRARGTDDSHFTSAEREMLVDAGNALKGAGVQLIAAPPVDNLVTAVTNLREDPRFASARPAQSAERRGVWAINLALITLPAQPPLPGMVTRKALRIDRALSRDAVLKTWGMTARSVHERVRTIADRLGAAEVALSKLSKNSRAPAIAGALAALDTLRRSHIRRGWELSQSGTTVVVRQLDKLCAAHPAKRGLQSWALDKRTFKVRRIEKVRDDDVIQEFDEAMAMADRILSRSWE